VTPVKPYPECATCPARNGKLVAPEPAQQGARLVVIGEAPSRAEVEERRVFTGSSGRFLGRGLRTLGLQRSDIHWTNAILCECAPDDQREARKSCQTRLTAELGAAVAAGAAAHGSPPVVMPVGALGLQGALATNKKTQILRWRGSVNPIELGGVATHACPTLHPAFVMRSPAWGPVLELDVERVGRVMAQGFTPPELQPGRRIVIAKELATLRAELPQLGPEVGVDVETVGLGPTSTLLVCLALSDGSTTLVIPWSLGRDGRQPWWPGAEPRVAALISECLASRVSITHNGPAFDHIVLARYGLKVAAWDDTLLAQHAVASHLPKRLSHCVTLSLDVTAWKEFEDRTATIERLWIYNARDTLYTVLRWFDVKAELRGAA